jgi:uncharacterized protein
MKFNRFYDVNRFYESAKDYLLSHEAQNNLLLGIARNLIYNPEKFKNSFLATVERDGNIVAVAMRTPPRPLVLSHIRDSTALEVITQELHANEEVLPGVSGLTVEAETFARFWQSLTGRSYQVREKLRIYQLNAVRPLAKASGYFRVATECDRALLLEWFKAFEIEALETSEEDAESAIDRRLIRKSCYLWEDRVPVSIFTKPSAIGPSAIGTIFVLRTNS